MESLPNELWKEPQPLVAVLGEVDWDPGIHRRLTAALHVVGLDQSGPLSTPSSVTVPFAFVNVPRPHVFPTKKSASILKASDGRPLDGYQIRGILKSDFLHKHATQIPSVVVLLAPMEMHWSVLEWGGRETGIIEDVERLRATLGLRDVKVLLVLLRRGAGLEDSREMDDRVMGLRRRGGLDNKTVYVLFDPLDLNPNSTAMRKLGKHVRELSSSYYISNCKRVKRYETSLSRSQLPLMSRYRFKQAFWYEFLGNTEKVLKHYRRTFESLQEIQAAHGAADATMGISTSARYTPAASAGLGGMAAQCKAVAEYVNFKICYYCMREARPAEAVVQFRRLIQVWSRLSSGSTGLTPRKRSLSTSSMGAAGALASVMEEPPESRMEFLHLEWLAKQYHIFGDLLHRFPHPQLSALSSSAGGSGGSGSGLAHEVDYWFEPDHFFFNAALYTCRRRGVALWLRRQGGDNGVGGRYAVQIATNFGLKGALLAPSLYVGGRPRLSDPSIEGSRSEADVNELVQGILEREEVRVDHSGIIRKLLQQAISVEDPSRTPRPRFKALQHLHLAEELVLAQMFTQAWDHYCFALRHFHDDHDSGVWPELATATLMGTRTCALAMGKRLEYLDLTLKLLGHELRSASSMAPARRRALGLEALYLLSGGAADLAAAVTDAFQRSPGPGLLHALDPGFGSPQAASTPTLSSVVKSQSWLDAHAYDPIVNVTPDVLEIGASCGHWQLLSFSIHFSQATQAMGSSCSLVLRLVSHFPVPIRPSQIDVRFNKAYMTPVTIHDTAELPPEARLKAVLSTPPRSNSNEKVSVEQEEARTAKAPLLLHPDEPLDLPVQLAIPSHEGVEVGDFVHATALRVVIGGGIANQIAILAQSGVNYVDGLGVIMANICCDDRTSGASASVPCTVQTPLRASLRGFPAVEVAHPQALASLSLETPSQEVGVMPVVTSLVEHMQCLWLRVDSNEDTLSNPVVYVRSDPPPRSNRPDDAFFFHQSSSEDGPEPMPLDKDLQPVMPLPVLGHDSDTLPPHSIARLPIYLRSQREGRVRVNLVLLYKTKAQEQRDDSLMVTTDLTFELDSHIPFSVAFDVASPAPTAIVSAPGHGLSGGKSSVYTFLACEEVMMRVAIKALLPAALHDSPARVEQVVWQTPEDSLGPLNIVRVSSQYAPTQRGRVLYLAEDLAADYVAENGGGGMQHNEVLSCSFSFMCPEKETVHPISLGRLFVLWSTVSSSAEGTGDRNGRCHREDVSTEREATPWISCTEFECPHVVVVRPELTIDLNAPLEARVGETFVLRWSLRNQTYDVLTVRALVTEGQGTPDGSLVWDGVKETMLQILPNEAIHVSLALVALVTGPLPLPRLSVTHITDDTSAPFKIRFSYVDNVAVPAAAQATAGAAQGGGKPDHGRHIFILPSLPNHGSLTCRDARAADLSAITDQS